LYAYSSCDPGGLHEQEQFSWWAKMDTLSILKRLVDRHGPAETARLVGVTYQSVWRWMTGKAAIRGGSAKLIRLAGEADEQGKVLEP
jgi:hypothetical protein